MLRRILDCSSYLLVNSIFVTFGVKALLEFDIPCPLFVVLFVTYFELSQPASGEAGPSDGALGLYYVITGAMFGTSVEILGASF